MAETEPCCYDCLSADVTITVIDRCGFEHWFCARCWASIETFREKISALLADAKRTLEAAL